MGTKTEYIVLCGQIVGGQDKGFEVVYGFDGQRFADRKSAIRHGFKLRDSDDFNIGVIEDGNLVSLNWMETVIDTEPGEIDRIAEQVCL